MPVKSSKVVLKFRAVKLPGHGVGPYAVEWSRGGGGWEPSVVGLTADGVARQFERLQGRGCVIVSTREYAWPLKAKSV